MTTNVTSQNSSWNWGEIAGSTIALGAVALAVGLLVAAVFEYILWPNDFATSSWPRILSELEWTGVVCGGGLALLLISFITGLCMPHEEKEVANNPQPPVAALPPQDIPRNASINNASLK